MKTTLNFLLVLLLALGNSRCVSIEKQISSGNYDQAITTAVSKLKGKTKKSPKYVIGLEEAFKFALQNNLEKIENLKRSNPKDADLQILRIYEKIERTQSAIQPLLPLTDKNGYRADIQFIDVSEGRHTYENRAADYLYEQALSSLRNARNGDRLAARKASGQIREMESITGSSKITQGLLQESKELGTSFFVLNPLIGSEISLSTQAAERFLNFGSTGFNSTWQIVHFKRDRKQMYDYEVKFIFDRFDISPEKENTREYQDKKEIEEDSGRKDQNGKKIMRKKEVVANIIELYQFKEIVASGTIIITDTKTGKDVFTDKRLAKKTFENYASTFKGDKRALSEISARRIGGKPLRFPSNDLMLDDVIGLIKEELAASLKKEYTKF